MSSGSLLVFGEACPFSSSLCYLPRGAVQNHAHVHPREQHTCILPPLDPFLPQPDASSSPPPPCLSVRSLIHSSLLLLEDGQVHSLDEFSSFKEESSWIRLAIGELNALRLPVVQVVVGGGPVTLSAAGRNAASSGVAGSALTRTALALANGQGYFFLVLTSVGEMWTFGRNRRGQLGLGHTRDVFHPTRVSKFAPTEEMGGDEVQQRREEEEEKEANVDMVDGSDPARPRANIKLASRSPLPTRIVQLAAGKEHSLALTSSGCLYAWGRDQEGQCGLATPQAAGAVPTGRTFSTYQPSMHVVPKFVTHLRHQPPLVQIAAANHVSLVVDQAGTVWHWGYGLAKQQLNVPTRVEFEEQPAPVITQVAVGHSHALLLSDQQHVYSFGLDSFGVLGHGADLASTSSKFTPVRLERARRISTPSSPPHRWLQVVCGSFASAAISDRGEVFSWGNNAQGQLGHDLPKGDADAEAHSAIHTPTRVSAASGNCVTQVSIGGGRMTLFVPTKLHEVHPTTLEVRGGTRVHLSGQGLFMRYVDGGESTDMFPPQIIVSFSYLDQVVQVVGAYEPVSGSVHCVSPDLRGTDPTNKRKGGLYRNGQLENCIVRVSLDGGQHFSNALSVHLFSRPNFSFSSSSSTPPCELFPPSGPLQGGTRLTLKAPFDMVPYPHLLVRFRIEAPDTPSVHRELIGTVSGEFDPTSSSIRCVAPVLPANLIPPSTQPPVSPNTPASKPSRFHRSKPTAPPASLIDSLVEVSLDGQNFFTCGSSHSPIKFQWHRVRAWAPGVTPECIGVAGADLEVRMVGVHLTSSSKLQLKFTVGPHGYQSITVPAKFVPLKEYRAKAKARREQEARQGRKRAKEAAEEARRIAEQLAWEEEENRDPKEKERMAREKEKLEKEKEKERLKAEKAAAAAAAASSSSPQDDSRPASAVSPQGSRPTSSATSSPSTTQPQPPLNKTGSVTSTGTRASTPHSLLSSSSEEQQDQSADGESQPSSADQPDEWAAFESHIASIEALEDASFAMLSPRDLEGVGVVMARAPIFTSFGECTPSIAISINGEDFVPLQQPEPLGPENNNRFVPAAPVQPLTLRVCRPRPLRLSPSCGPRSGGTVVRVEGEHFYFTPDIQVQLRPVVPVPPTPSPAVAAVAAGTGANLLASPANSRGSRPISAASPTPGAVLGSAHKKASGSGGDKSARSKAAAAAEAAESTPPTPSLPPPSPQILPAEFVVSATNDETSSSSSSSSSSLRFRTPAWPATTGSSASLTTVHVGFDPAQNAFQPSVDCTAPSSSSLSSPSLLPFTFYDSPHVFEAHPSTISQSGGTEVTLVGRGFVESECIRVRLTLVEEEDAKTKRGAGAGAEGTGEGARVGTASSASANSARRKASSKSFAAGVVAAASSLSDESDPSAAASVPLHRYMPVIDVPATFHANDSVDDEEPRAGLGKGKQAQAKPKGAPGGARATGGAGNKDGSGEGEAEAATLTFLTPAATAFNSDFADGSAVNRVLEVELALNGQQFVQTGIQLKFEKDNKPKKKK